MQAFPSGEGGRRRGGEHLDCLTDEERENRNYPYGLSSSVLSRSTTRFAPIHLPRWGRLTMYTAPKMTRENGNIPFHRRGAHCSPAPMGRTLLKKLQPEKRASNARPYKAWGVCGQGDTSKTRDFNNLLQRGRFTRCTAPSIFREMGTSPFAPTREGVFLPPGRSRPSPKVYPYPQYFLSRERSWMASATCSARMTSLAARSAMVRATRSTRS